MNNISNSMYRSVSFFCKLAAHVSRKGNEQESKTNELKAINVNENIQFISYKTCRVKKCFYNCAKLTLFFENNSVLYAVQVYALL